MVKEFSTTKKYLLVLTMMGIFCFILFYIFKKVSTKRMQYLKELARVGDAKHGESAIFEEQSAILDEKEDEDEEKIGEKDMKIDLTQYFEYRKYEPQKLWDTYIDNLQEKTANQQKIYDRLRANSTSSGVAGEIRNESCEPRVEIQIYYQTFVHLFRVNVVSLTNMNCFRTNDSKNLKLKIMVRKQAKDCFSEVTDTYPFGGDDDDNDDGDGDDEVDSNGKRSSIEFTDKFYFPMKIKEIHEYFVYISVWSVNVFYHEFLLGAAHVDLSNYGEYTEKKNIFADIVPVKKVFFFFLIKDIQSLAFLPVLLTNFNIIVIVQSSVMFISCGFSFRFTNPIANVFNLSTPHPYFFPILVTRCLTPGSTPMSLITIRTY